MRTPWLSSAKVFFLARRVIYKEKSTMFGTKSLDLIRYDYNTLTVSWNSLNYTVSLGNPYSIV